MRSMKRSTIIFLFLIAILAGIFAPIHEAKAGWFRSALSCIANPTLCLAGKALNFAKDVYQAGSVIGAIFFEMSKDVETLMDASQIIPDEVKIIWKQIRDLANLFFILVLIIMAFATIFDIKNWNFKSLFAQFLIAALLINFSFAIGEYILKIGNGLANVELTTIKDALKGAGMSDLFTRGLYARLIFGNGVEQFIALTGGASALGARLLLTLFFGVISFIALLVVWLFLLIRTPVIWILLIVSPIAYLGLAIPSIKKQVWDGWWKAFLGWVFWMPAYIFILMMLAILLRIQPKVTGNELLGGNALIYFFLTLFFMLGGIWASFKVGSVIAGGGAAATGKFIQDKLLQGMKYGAMKTPIPIGANKTTNLAAEAEGIQRTWKRFMGTREQNQKIKDAGAAGRWQDVMGFTPNRQEEMEISRAIHDEQELLKGMNMDVDKFKEELIASKGGSAKRRALRMLQAENGWFETEKELLESIQEMGGSGTVAGRQLLEALEKSNYRNIDTLKDSAGKLRFADSMSTTDPRLRKSLYANMAKLNQLTNIAPIQAYLKMTANDAYEKRESAKKEVRSNLSRVLKSDNERIKELNTPTLIAGTTDEAKETRKILASIMMENEEIKDNKTYEAAIDVGINSTELHEKINKYSPLLGTEIDFRAEAKKMGTIIPKDLNTMSATQKAVLTARFAKTISSLKGNVNTRAEKIADAPMEEWGSDAFYEALRATVVELETKEPTVKEHEKKMSDGTLMLKGEVAGAGKRLLIALQSSTNDPAKVVAIKRLKVEIEPLAI